MAFSDRGLSRGEIIGMLRKLEALELGSYVTGRKGHPSRFEWKYASRDIAMMATGDETKTNPEPAPQVDEDEPEAVMHMHQFLLRTDLKVQFELPVDLTQAEAARLADYVKTLPLGG